MQKKRLDKLFYSNPAEYEQEYRRRFDDPDTIHLPLTINEHPAFFYVTPQMLNQIAAIERADKGILLQKQKLPPAAIHQFIRNCLIDEILLTNNIEGVHSTRREIDAVLQNPQKKQRFFGIVRKYQQLEREEEISLQTCQDIRNLYDDLFRDEIAVMDEKDLPDGQIFRKESVHVHSATDKVIHTGLYPERIIIDTMQQALQFLNNNSVDMLIRIAVFHYLFGYIHPFYDGNGRTSRFISSYLLSRQLDPLMGYRISYTIKAHIGEYYKAFKICNNPNNKGDLTPFIEMFLGIVETAAKNLLQALAERAERLRYYSDRIANLPAIDWSKKMPELYYALIQAALFSDNGVSRKDLLEYLEVSANTLTGMLTKIPDAMLMKTTENRRIFYKLELDAINAYLSQQ